VAKKYVIEEAPVREQVNLRMAITGAQGSGKSYTALNLMYYLMGGKKFGVIDSERGRAKLYLPAPKQKPNPEKGTFPFVYIKLDSYDTLDYIAAIDVMIAAGIKGLVIDGISHAWEGQGGLLDQKSQLDARPGSNNYTNWAGITKKQNEFINKLLDYPGHLIVTMRSKVDYVIDASSGKNQVRKIGLQPVQRDGVSYEFDIEALMEDATMSFTKLRNVPELKDKTFKNPGKEVAEILIDWLGIGVEMPLDAQNFKTRMAGLGFDDNDKLKAFADQHPEVTGPFRYTELLKLAEQG